MEKEEFNKWNNLKQEINSKNNIHYKEREIWFCSIGQNVGSEENGKGELFLRPILIIKSISSKVFIGVPLTSKSKTNGFYYDFSYVKNKKSYGILFQIRLFDTKRLKYKSGKINEDVFCKIKEKIREMFL